MRRGVDEPERVSGRPTYYFPEAFRYFRIYIYTTEYMHAYKHTYMYVCALMFNVFVRSWFLIATGLGLRLYSFNN